MGTDFAVGQGTELRATTSGNIRTYSGAGGNGIDIVTGDGLVVRNWHISEFRVNAGDYVEAGQIIGLTGGGAGTWGAGNSTGPHLHWEIRDNTRFNDIGWIDPRGMTVYSFDGAAPSSPAPSGPVIGSQGEGIRSQGSDWTYWVPGTSDQQTVQSRLAERGFYNGPIDGDLASDASVRAIKLACGELGYFDLNFFDGEINKNLCYGILLLAQNHGGYSGFNNLFTDGYVWAAFDSGVASAIAIPAAPAPAPEPVPTEPVVEAPVVETTKPAETKPTKPVTTPQKEKPMTAKELAKQQEQIAALPTADLGVIIPTVKGRKIAYAIFAATALVITNTAVAFAALQEPWPAWLIVSVAVIGNLATPFAALAIANASDKK